MSCILPSRVLVDVLYAIDDATSHFAVGLTHDYSKGYRIQQHTSASLVYVISYSFRAMRMDIRSIRQVVLIQKHGQL